MFSLKESMNFQVTSASIEQSIMALIENHADVAFHTKPIEHKSIENRRFISARQVCVLPKSHSLAQKDKLCVADLQNQKMIFVPKTDPCYHEHQDIDPELAGDPLLHPRHANGRRV